jgi:hypothetical protein
MDETGISRLALAVVAAWLLLHARFYDVFLVHDSWIHIFPIVFSVSRDMDCSGLPHWLSMVDTGAPHVVYTISSSLTHLLRLPVLYAMGCAALDVPAATYLYKAQIYASYLGFGLGMYVLGRALYERRESAVYLLAATLFTGLCLDSAHSDQVVSMLFWVPWVAASLVLFWRHRHKPSGAAFLNAAVLFASAELLDQYPHFIVLALFTAALIMLLLWPMEVLTGIGRNWRRLWPSLIVLAIVAFQLIVVKNGIVDYRPSLRSELVVDPSKFGETGFAQPTAFLGSLLPLSMLAAHDTLAAGLAPLIARGSQAGATGFMYRFDVLFFHVGVVPLLLFFAFLAGAMERRVKIGWCAFGLLLFLYALQQSKLYFLLHHLPFFDVFRSYGLYLAYAVFAFLVMSGLGLDALLRSDMSHRADTIARSIRWVQASGIAVLLGFAWLVTRAPGKLALLYEIKWYLLIDVALLVLTPLAFSQLCRKRVGNRAMMIAIVAALVVSQSIYATGVYRILGVPYDKLQAQFGLEGNDRIPLAHAVATDPAQFMRKECVRYTQCYLSLRPSASLRTDLEGSFLRSRRSVLYQEQVSKSVILALLGISHPVFWPSQELRYFDSPQILAATLNGYGDAIGEHLRAVTYAPKDSSLAQIAAPPREAAPLLRTLQRGQDWYRIDYQSSTDFYLNMSITYDPGWSVYVNNARIRVERAYFDGMAVRLPAGSQVVELRYEPTSSRVFFFSRCLLLLAAVFSLLLVWRWVRMKPPQPK